MTQPRFQIERRAFSLPASLGAVDSFTVRSVPRPYGVRWERDRPAAVLQRQIDESPPSVLLIDERVWGLFGRELIIDSARVHSLPATESAKTLEHGVLPVVEFLMRMGVTKSDRLLVVGGGIVQDVAAFAAAMYRRGIPWTFLPTTLLSMSDSCIGAKAGLNYANAKNQLGLFCAPAEVVLCPGFLETLPRREARAGLGEVLKLHVTAGEVGLARYEDLTNGANLDAIPDDALKALILGALEVKRAVIEADEFEDDLRRGLNYGHTLGHVVEASSCYAVPHGLAVIVGMLAVNTMATSRGLLPEEQRQRIERVGQALLDEDCCRNLREVNKERLGELLQRDKKTRGRQVTLVVPAPLGRLRFVGLEITESLVEEVAAALRAVAARHEPR